MFENLIAVSYCGGARGNAVAYAISFSQEVVPPWAHMARKALDGRGAIWVKSRPYDRSRAAFHDIVSIHNRLGHDMYHRDRSLPPDVIDAYATAYEDLVIDPGNARLVDALVTNRVVIADHADPLHNLVLYPGCMAVAVHSNWKSSLRDFMSKHLSRPSEEDAGMTNMDREVMMDGLPICDSSRKIRLHGHAHQLRLSNGHRDTDDRMVIVDSDRLFSHGTAHDEYHRMVDRLGITPRWDMVGQWITRYMDRQWKR